MRDLFQNEHAVILYYNYIKVFMSPFTLSLHLFFDRPLFLRRAVDCHYKTRQTDTRQNWENAPNCRAPNWHRVEMGRAQLDRVKQARVKKDVPNWTDSVITDVFAELFRTKCLRTATIIAILSDFLNFEIKPEMRDVLAKMRECGK